MPNICLLHVGLSLLSLTIRNCFLSSSFLLPPCQRLSLPSCLIFTYSIVSSFSHFTFLTYRSLSFYIFPSSTLPLYYSLSRVKLASFTFFSSSFFHFIILHLLSSLAHSVLPIIVFPLPLFLNYSSYPYSSSLRLFMLSN